MTIPDGNSLRGIPEIIANMRGLAGTRPLAECEVQIALHGDPQSGLITERHNRNNLQAAIYNVPADRLAGYLAAILAQRFGPARASLIARDAAEIIERSGK